jgi:ComF family protein
VSKFANLFNLLIPSQCALCNRSGWTLCETCLDQLELPSHQAHRSDLRGCSLAKYAEPLPSLLSIFKERGETEVAHRLVSRLNAGPVLEMINSSGQLSHKVANDEPHLVDQKIYLVPIPSSKNSMKTRGFNPAEQVAKALYSRLHNQGHFRVARVLSRRLEINDQASLNISQRWQNQAGSMGVRHSVTGLRCLLVDDIVTTGATLLEARKTLVAQGASVIGFFTLAETFLNRATQK